MVSRNEAEHNRVVQSEAGISSGGIWALLSEDDVARLQDESHNQGHDVVPIEEFVTLCSEKEHKTRLYLTQLALYRQARNADFPKIRRKHNKCSVQELSAIALTAGTTALCIADNEVRRVSAIFFCKQREVLHIDYLRARSLLLEEANLLLEDVGLTPYPQPLSK